MTSTRMGSELYVWDSTLGDGWSDNGKKEKGGYLLRAIERCGLKSCRLSGLHKGATKGRKADTGQNWEAGDVQSEEQNGDDFSGDFPHGLKYISKRPEVKKGAG